MSGAGTRRARRRDRRVYLAGHPVLFVLLAATRRRPVVRIGRTVLVHGGAAYHEVLTRLPLDRTAAGTTGGAAAELTGGGLLFDQDGDDHRAARRTLAADLGARTALRLRPRWQAVLDERLAVLGRGLALDLVPLAAELAGLTAAALTTPAPTAAGPAGAPDPLLLAHAATEAAAATARDHLPGRRRPGGAEAAATAAARLNSLLPDGLDAMLAVAAVNTTVAALPRAAAWCADAGLWAGLTPDNAPGVASELLRLTAPSPVLPRVAAAGATVAGCPIARGDRLVLVARHAAESHRDTPVDPARATQAVFGAGPHACPGAAAARALLAEFLLALAPYRPTVVRARADHRSALPGWAELQVRAGRPAGRGASR
ncbi:cytochrome P450 [Kitasatospora sp. NBC_00315]|uniref:cytochrome P450 n=1 Tax=Kitasatospora sp. NBC_00315 TaxID=2975963 RepID=UPI003253C718